MPNFVMILMALNRVGLLRHMLFKGLLGGAWGSLEFTFTQVGSNTHEHYT